MRLFIYCVVFVLATSLTDFAQAAEEPTPPLSQDSVQVFDEVCLAKIAAGHLKIAEDVPLLLGAFKYGSYQGASCRSVGQAQAKEGNSDNWVCTQLAPKHRELETAQSALAYARITAARDNNCIRTIHGGEGAVLILREARRLLQDSVLQLGKIEEKLRDLPAN